MADVLVVVFLSLIKVFFLSFFEPLIQDVVLLFFHGFVLFVSDLCNKIKFLFFLSSHTFLFKIVHVELHSVSDGGKDVVNILIDIGDFFDETAGDVFEGFLFGLVKDGQSNRYVGDGFDHFNVFHESLLSDLDQFGYDIVQVLGKDFLVHKLLPFTQLGRSAHFQIFEIIKVVPQFLSDIVVLAFSRIEPQILLD